MWSMKPVPIYNISKDEAANFGTFLTNQCRSNTQFREAGLIILRNPDIFKTVSWDDIEFKTFYERPIDWMYQLAVNYCKDGVMHLNAKVTTSTRAIHSTYEEYWKRNGQNRSPPFLLRLHGSLHQPLFDF